MKRTTMGGTVILTMMLAGNGGELSAQQERAPGARAEAPMERMDRAGRIARGVSAPGVEDILRMRDRLGLTGEQVTQLDALRGERVRERAAVASEMADLRSQLRAGTLEQTVGRERLRAAARARRTTAEEARAEVELLLTTDQWAAVEQLQAQRRAFEAGRRSGMRGQARGARLGGDRPSRDRGWRGPRGGR